MNSWNKNNHIKVPDRKFRPKSNTAAKESLQNNRIERVENSLLPSISSKIDEQNVRILAKKSSKPNAAIADRSTQKVPLKKSFKSSTSLMDNGTRNQNNESQERGKISKSIDLNLIKILDFEFNFLHQNETLINSLLRADSPQTFNNSNVLSTVDSKLSMTNNNPAIIHRSDHIQTFSIVSAVGLDGTGKSSLLNSIAQNEIFPTRSSLAEKNSENPLSHVTCGIDMHVTAERIFLLDTQPLLSASVLDELLKQDASKSSYAFAGSTQIFSSLVGFDIAEMENFAFIYSLQLLTFLMTVCNHVILVIDSFTLDTHLFKLLATACMMLTEAVLTRFNLIIYLKNDREKQRYWGDSNSFARSTEIESKFKKSFINLGLKINFVFINNDESLLFTTVVRPQQSFIISDSASSIINYQSERLWFHSIQKFWENLTKKSSLYSEYAKYLP
ncbi:Protein SMG9 [Sarcoptes scabiei]|uniref:Protein SMG9 n=1 Tax=Sarcoptes scabiei TaxID=52283 RepID=A0A834RFN3_SARSC|nr:Protein SMG9 [Sarcoptes scabiei]